MKALRYISIIAVVSTVFFSCTEEEPDIPTPKLTFSDQVEADFESIAISCTVSGNVSADNLAVEYSTDKSLSSSQKKIFEKEGDVFCVTISQLEVQTTYYYRYIVYNKASEYKEDKLREFKTRDYIAPEVLTGEVKNVSGTKATLEGSIEFTCGEKMQEKGFFFGKDRKNLEAKPTMESTLTLSLEGLEFETTYYYQAYARSEIGIGKGEIKEFKTCNAVSFNPVSIENITASSAVVTGGIQDDGGVEIEQQGFRYSVGDSGDYMFVASTGETIIDNLKAATLYKVWYYAKTFEGVFESNKVEFNTSDGTIAFGETTIIAIMSESICLKTSVSADGGSSISERGYVYGTETLPTVDGSHVSLTGTLGQMSGEIIDLTNNTTYYIRPYAINGVGVSYGSQITVGTLSGLAELGQVSLTEIMAESVVFSCDIISSNGATISSAGFCYGLAHNPTTSDSKVTAQSTSGQFSALVGSLEKKTTYYVRAFATTKHGTSYGPENTFTTKDGSIVFAGITVSEIQPESAKVSVIISDDGGSSISERGFCFSTSVQPTVSNNKTTVSSSEATYSGILSSLSRSTQYYVRAYAKNAVGTYYSVQKVFSTTDGLSSLATLHVLNIEATSATLSCDVISDGGASITDRGFCYATSPSPTISSSLNHVSGALGSMQKDIIDLEPGTPYYARAYSTTKYGTSYSNEVSFITLSSHEVIDEIIDLGLSVKWRAWNVGALKPEEYGYYYAWGETDPKSDYTDSTYLWYNYDEISGKYTCAKYNLSSSYGIVDNKSEFKDYNYVDDAARVFLGGKWRTPAVSEWEELIEKCNWTWTSNYNGTGVAGIIVRSNVNGFKDKWIFLPAAGQMDGASIKYTINLAQGERLIGLYMSSFCEGPNSIAGGFTSDDFGLWWTGRERGYPVRPVLE